MNSPLDIFLKAKKWFFHVIGLIITFIYNAIFSRFISAQAYQGMTYLLEDDLSRIKKVLDVGVGTGMSLYRVIDKFDKDTQILGIDFNELYVENSKKLFREHKNVQIRAEDFYKFAPDTKYDLIILGFSFMLMPNPEKALSLAIGMLAPGGKIVFLLTMHKNKNRIMDRIKPWFKLISTIDFGRMTYEDQFIGLLDQFNLNVVKKTRLGDQYFSNQVMFKIFNVWVFETELKSPSQESLAT